MVGHALSISDEEKSIIGVALGKNVYVVSIVGYALSIVVYALSCLVYADG